MKFILIVFTFLITEVTFAQDLRYSISVPNGGRMGYEKLPDSIDTGHYYSHREIRYLAEPVDGWASFYDKLKTLEYPQKAKDQQLQTKLKVWFQVNQDGKLNTLLVKYIDIKGKWKKCEVCEDLIYDLFRNIEWKAGTLHGESVKTVDSIDIEFRIYDPKANKSPFGY